MKRIFTVLSALFLLIVTLTACQGDENISQLSSGADNSSGSENMKTFTISEKELYDKIRGSWLGQAAGVVWGADQEFWYAGVTMPDDKVPDIASLDLNGVFGQDDLYVEIPFMTAMKEHGVDCGLDVIAEAFKNTKFGLDHANKIARENLIAGIPAPQSGDYIHNLHCDDIDWQIEADFLGCIYPGLVSDAAERAFELGHITNYGDGVYGGVFVAAMHSAAFTAQSVSEIIDAGVKSIPEGTKFRQVMDDVISWYDEGCTWLETWQKLQDKWDKTKRCPWYANGATNIDAKMNAAYILIGLLYGEGDFDASMRISMQCGQDSDCNPSSVGAILGNYYGYDAIDAKWKNLDMESTPFSYTEYSFNDCVQLNYELALEFLEKRGFENNDGVWTLSTSNIIEPVEFEQWPDMPTLSVEYRQHGSLVILTATAHDINGEVNVTWQTGDGTEYQGTLATHVYSEAGTFTVTCKAENVNGNSTTVTETIEVTDASGITPPQGSGYRNLAQDGLILCTVYEPTGSGAKDINVIRDGVKNGSNEQQYDTYAGYLGAHDEIIGYIFGGTVTVDKVVFTEGMHFNNGGWFVGETLNVELLIDGEWQSVEYTSSPRYQEGNAAANYGAWFETFTFSFESTECSGVRLRGTAGGDAGFVGVAELEVWGE